MVIADKPAKLVRKSYGESEGRSLPVDHGQRSADGMERARLAGKHVGRPRKVKKETT